MQTNTRFLSLSERPDQHSPPMALAALAADIAEKCTGCGKCLLGCAFLSGNGKPGELAADFLSNESDISVYECNLCGLCSEVCPENLQVTSYFLNIRRLKVTRGSADLRPYRRLLAYERLGSSPRFRQDLFPEHCQTVFFPGCNLPGTRPRQTQWLFETMKEGVPDLGLVLDCCRKPSHDLGRQEWFEEKFMQITARLIDHGIKKVLTGCPSCFWVFKQYGGPLQVESVYEVLDAMGVNARGLSTDYQVHDACATRSEQSLQMAVRELAAKSGAHLVDSKSSGKYAICCGEGGGVHCVNPDLAGSWGERRKREAGTLPVLTYCGGCSEFLGRKTTTTHILDLLYDRDKAVAGAADVARGPTTYFNRLMFKQRMRKMVNSSPMVLGSYFSTNTQKIFVAMGGVAAIIAMLRFL